jgi:hypothetical protein
MFEYIFLFCFWHEAIKLTLTFPLISVPYTDPVESETFVLVDPYLKLDPVRTFYEIVDASVNLACRHIINYKRR